jgi:sugar/nucleoside kinase (ribokinase family)
MQPYKLVVYGDVAMDILVRVEAMPALGQDALAEQITLAPAGSAANCAAVAARLGAAVEFVGLTGRDALGDLLMEDLRSFGVGLRHLRQAEGVAAVVVAIVNGEGERTMYSQRGISATQPYGALPGDLLAAGDCLHLSGYSFQDEYGKASALALIEQARRAGARVSLDPSFHFARQFVSEHAASLPQLDYLFPNQEEAALMSGVADPAEAARRLQRCVAQSVVVKLGGQGCLVATAQDCLHVPALPAPRVVDTTGAGDAFCGGFLYAILQGWTPLAAARLGHAAAVQVIGQVGGRRTAPTWADVAPCLTGYLHERLT